MAATKTWVVLTLNDLRHHLIDAQVKKTLEWETAPGDDPLTNNPFDNALHETANEVRTAIASNPANVLSATAYSVPPECERMTSWLIINSLRFRFATVATLTEEQQKEVAKAEAQLEMIRNWRDAGRQFIISSPTDPETEPAQIARTPAETWYYDRLATRETLKGL